MHGALGVELTEYFDYLGYKRNEQFFLMRDYTDIPCSNLVHVLRGKNVLLTGDFILCQMLINYLESIEKGEICIKYVSMSDTVLAKKMIYYVWWFRIIVIASEM